MKNARGVVVQAASAAAGVVAALLVAAALRGAPLVPGRGGPPEGYLAARDPYFTLYAPSPRALAEGRAELGWAVERFRRHFGVEPRPLVVVLADSPAAFQHMDLGALRPRGTRLIPFLTRAHLESARDSAVLALDAGAVLEPRDSTARVVSVVDVDGPVADLRVGDEVVAINGVGAEDWAALGRAFRAIPLGEPVRVDVRRAGRVARVEYRRAPTDALAARVYAQATARFAGQVKSLAHEACHGFVAAYADGLDGRARSPGGYGHGALPDWFDEMAAILCEGDASRERRRVQLRAGLEGRIPLAELAAMEHPLSAERLERAAAGRGLVIEEVPVQLVTGPLLRDALSGTRAELFYAQSLSVGEFLYARGGAPALQALARELAAGRAPDEALRRVHRVVPAVPPGVAPLEAEWLAWERRAGR
jgi:hypothetical protein